MPALIPITEAEGVWYDVDKRYINEKLPQGQLDGEIERFYGRVVRGDGQGQLYGRIDVAFVPGLLGHVQSHPGDFSELVLAQLYRGFDDHGLRLARAWVS